MYIKVYEDKLVSLESTSFLSRKEHIMLPRGDDYYMYIAKECLSGLAEELKQNCKYKGTKLISSILTFIRNRAYDMIK